jgi:hypothetical protein
MADISITSASVIWVDGPKTTGICGEAITKAGMPLYQNSSDLKLYMCIDTSQAAAACVGVSLNVTSAANQPITYAQPGANVTYNAALTEGAGFYVTDTAGGLSLFADRNTGDWLQLVGVATSTTNLFLICKAVASQVD